MINITAAPAAIPMIMIMEDPSSGGVVVEDPSSGGVVEDELVVVVGAPSAVTVYEPPSQEEDTSAGEVEVMAVLIEDATEGVATNVTSKITVPVEVPIEPPVEVVVVPEQTAPAPSDGPQLCRPQPPDEQADSSDSEPLHVTSSNQNESLGMLSSVGAEEAKPRLSCAQTTLASFVSQLSSHT